MALRILFLSHKFYPDVGGIEVNSEILARAFHEAGHQVHLLTWSKDTSKTIFPFKVIRNPGKIRLVKEHHWADILFENNPCLRLAWPSIFFRKPYVVALRTWISRLDGSLNWQDRLKLDRLKHASAVIAVSNSVRNKCWPAATVIGNPYRSVLFRILPKIERTKDFVFLGRLVSDKGVELAINAIFQLNTLQEQLRIPAKTYTLTIIGEGKQHSKLATLVRQLNIQHIVKFAGAMRGEELVTCLNRHKYLLVPSIWEEPFGNVALEGMACGCIPIVSDGGGLPDAVGNAGLIFKRGSLESLVECIQGLLKNQVLERELRGAATTHLSTHHPHVVSSSYLKVIEEAVIHYHQIK